MNMHVHCSIAIICTMHIPTHSHTHTHTQVRQQQILDNTAQKHKAYLSQGKGLQSRRLPSNLAEKVPEDYSARRRAQTYGASELRRSARSVPSLSPTREETDSGDSMSAMTDEERKKKVKKLREFIFRGGGSIRIFLSHLLYAAQFAMHNPD